jgi:glucose/arabinose dehydrogenase
VAFSPDQKFLFLTAGDRQRFTPAQDPNQPAGKILRLTLDGKPAPGNPMEGKTGARSVPVIDPPRDTEAAKTAPVVRTYVFDGPNLTPSETWSSGHRTPYGLAFAPDGRLWELEHGPRGGDELNLIEPGKNYGWPLVSYAVNYDGVPIASPDTRPDLAKPAIYWTPVLAPGNLMFYSGAMFPKWKGSAFAPAWSAVPCTGSRCAARRDTGRALDGRLSRARRRAGARRRAVADRGRHEGGLYRLTPK